MGNDTSSMKIHSLLTADDLKDLRNAFPGGGASPTPVTSLNWGSWKSGLYTIGHISYEIKKVRFS